MHRLGCSQLVHMFKKGLREVRGFAYLFRTYEQVANSHQARCRQVHKQAQYPWVCFVACELANTLRLEAEEENFLKKTKKNNEHLPLKR